MQHTKPMMKFSKNGVITLNRMACQVMKDPTRVVIHIDLGAGLLGLQAVDEGHPHSVRLRATKSGGATVSVKSLYERVEQFYTSPICAEARYHGDAILAAPVLPTRKAS